MGWANTPASSKDATFINNIITEAANARRKFPSSNLSLAALTEEVGELAKAMLHAKAGKAPVENIWKEAIQVAVMAMRVATEGDPSFDAVEYKE